MDAERVRRLLLERKIATMPELKAALETEVDVTVCHYPSGASKWNPIEHRLFSEISKNWAGQPLRSYETILNHIRTTKT